MIVVNDFELYSVLIVFSGCSVCYRCIWMINIDVVGGSGSVGGVCSCLGEFCVLGVGVVVGVGYEGLRFFMVVDYD